jgi:hypothetical protein
MTVTTFLIYPAMNFVLMDWGDLQRVQCRLRPKCLLPHMIKSVVQKIDLHLHKAHNQLSQ